MAKLTNLSVVIVSWNSAEELPSCLSSLRSAALHASIDIEILVVDNASTDTSVREALTSAAVVLRNPVNGGFALAACQGAAVCGGEWILSLNPDTEVHEEFFAAFLEALPMFGPDVGMVVPEMRYRTDPTRISCLGLAVDRYGVPAEFASGRRIDDVPDGPVFAGSGGGCLYRRRALDEVGFYEPCYFAYLEDVDLGWRLQRAGWRAEIFRAAVIFHSVSSSTGSRSRLKAYLVARNRRLLFRVNGPHGLRCRFARGVIDLAHMIHEVVALRSIAPIRGRVDALRFRHYTAGDCANDPVRNLPLSKPPTLSAVLARKRRARALSHGGAE